MAEKQAKRKSSREEWAEKLNISADDPNFEHYLRDALANEPADTVRSTLILTGVIEPNTKHVPFDGKCIPEWLQMDRDREN